MNPSYYVERFPSHCTPSGFPSSRRGTIWNGMVAFPGGEWGLRKQQACVGGRIVLTIYFFSEVEH